MPEALAATHARESCAADSPPPPDRIPTGVRPVRDPGVVDGWNEMLAIGTRSLARSRTGDRLRAEVEAANIATQRKDKKDAQEDAAARHVSARGKDLRQ